MDIVLLFKMMLLTVRDVCYTILDHCDGPSQLNLRGTCKDWLSIAEKLAEKGYDETARMSGINCLALVREIQPSNEGVNISSTPATYLRVLINICVRYKKLRLAEFIINALISYSATYKGVIVHEFLYKTIYPTPFWAGVTRTLMSHGAPVEGYTPVVLAAYMNDTNLMNRLMKRTRMYIFPPNGRPVDEANPEYGEYSRIIMEFVVRYNYRLDSCYFKFDGSYRYMSRDECARLEDMNPSFWTYLKSKYRLIGSKARGI